MRVGGLDRFGSVRFGLAKGKFRKIHHSTDTNLPSQYFRSKYRYVHLIVWINWTHKDELSRSTSKRDTTDIDGLVNGMGLAVAQTTFTNNFLGTPRSSWKYHKHWQDSPQDLPVSTRASLIRRNERCAGN
jgi:hypothetical protein